MKLTEFSCGMAPLTNLLPLAGMPLERLSFSPSGITRGLEAVRQIATLDRIEAEGDPRFWELGHLPAVRFWRIVDLAGELEKAGLLFNKLDVTDGGSIRLDASGKDWKDLRALKGLPIEWLDIAETGVVDLGPLRGMPLAYLNLLGTSIEDVSALEGMPLEDVRFNPNRVTTGLDFLRGMKTLVRIGTEVRKSMPPLRILAALRFRPLPPSPGLREGDCPRITRMDTDEGQEMRDLRVRVRVRVRGDRSASHSYSYTYSYTRISLSSILILNPCLSV